MLKSFYDELAKECFWDYDICGKSIENIIKSNNKIEKRKLFLKFIYNAKDKLRALRLFSKDELREFFDKVEPNSNQKYINRYFSFKITPA